MSMDLENPSSDFSSLSLKDLRHIYSLHKTLNFVQAAKLVGITQSALSQSIANIEQRMGIELFKRTRRSVSSTVYSQLIAGRATSIINSLNDINLHINALRGVREGEVAFGIGIFAAGHLLEPVMSKFHQNYSDIHMLTFVDHVGELQSKLISGDIDLFVAGRDPQFRDSFPLRDLLYKDELIVVGRRKHPLVSKAPISALELIHFPIATYDGGFLQRQIYQLLEKTEEFKLLDANLPAAVLQQPWILAGFAKESDYLIVSSRAIMQPWLKYGDLVRIEISDLLMEVEIELVKRNDAYSSPAVGRLEEVIRQVIDHQHLNI